MNDTNDTPDKKSAAPAPARGRYFDVVRPGHSPASPTSRPVIVTHKPEVKNTLIGGETSRVTTTHDDGKRPLMTNPRTTVQPADSSLKPSAPPVRQKDAASLEQSSTVDDAMQQPVSTREASNQPTMTDPAAVTAASNRTRSELTRENGADRTPAGSGGDEEANGQQDLQEGGGDMTSTGGGVDGLSESPPEVTQHDSGAAPTPVAPLPLAEQAMLDDASASLKQDKFVSEHAKSRRTHRWLAWLIILVAALLLAGIILDVLLDTDILTLQFNLPHTHFFH